MRTARPQAPAYDQQSGQIGTAFAAADIMPAKQIPGSPLEVLRVFLKLGLTSFGGPIAHLGYFREEFVVRRSGSTSKPSSIWLRSASFCRDLPQARLDFPSG